MRSLLLILLLSGFTVFTAHAQCPPAKASGVHVVQKGETLYRISIKYKVTVDQLRQWNNLASDALAICQELKVSANSSGAGTGAATTTTSTTNTIPAPVYPKQSGPTHIVQRGETVASIARLYGYTEARFRKFNNLSPGQAVAQGTVLKSDDCQCPQLSQTASEPVVSYESLDQAISPSSMFSEPKTMEQSAQIINNTTQPAEAGPTGTPQTTYTPAEEMLADRKNATKPGSNSTAANPVVSTDFKPATAPYMTFEERSMADEINLIRSNPAGYIPVIEAFKRNIQAGVAAGSVDACDELIGELKSMKPLNVLEPAECIYNAAKMYGEELRTTGIFSHKGNDGSWPWDRVRRACPTMKDGNENLVGGPASVRDAVVMLLVDSEIPSRGHRRIMLNKDWNYIACYKIGQAGAMPNSWVQQFGR